MAPGGMQGEDPGLPANALVCFVLLKGPFLVEIDLPPGTPGKTDPIATEIGMVFDAHTGNLLEWGILDSPHVSSSTPANAQRQVSFPIYAYTQPSAPSISYSCTYRCYGANYWPKGVNGAYTYLNWPYYVTLFGAGNGLLRNTMWIVDETEPNNCYVYQSDLPSICFVEAGLKASISGGSNHTNLYWADVRPGYYWTEHVGAEVNTLYSTCCIDIQAWKAGTIDGISWCPVAAVEWCVDIYSEGDGQEMTGVSGDGNTNRMKVAGYREGLELQGASGATANSMYFNDNQWESAIDNRWNWQTNDGDPYKYMSNSPVDDYWNYYPASGNNGGEWVTCITGSGC